MSRNVDTTPGVSANKNSFWNDDAESSIYDMFLLPVFNLRQFFIWYGTFFL